VYLDIPDLVRGACKLGLSSCGRDVSPTSCGTIYGTYAYYNSKYGPVVAATILLMHAANILNLM